MDPLSNSFQKRDDKLPKSFLERIVSNKEADNGYQNAY